MGKSKEQQDAENADAQAEQARKANESEERRRREEQKKLVAQQKQDMINLYGEQSRQSADQGRQDVRKQASARGMLYSGIRQGGEADVNRQAAQGLSEAMQGAAAGEQAQQAGLEMQGAQAGLRQYGSDINREQKLYMDRLERWKSNPAGEIGSAVGKLGGAFLPF